MFANSTVDRDDRVASVHADIRSLDTRDVMQEDVSSKYYATMHRVTSFLGVGVQTEAPSQ
jgi:hypothetical protein